MNVDVFQADTDGRGVRVAVAQARFNDKLTDKLRDACMAELGRLRVDSDDVFFCSVPGALEIPSALEMLARSRQFDVLIALGAVVRGETYHFEIVSNESAAGLTRVAQDLSTPIANAIITVDNEEQGLARVEEKGADAARVAVEMANLSEYISEVYGDDDDDDDDDDEDDDDDDDEDDDEDDDDDED